MLGTLIKCTLALYLVWSCHEEAAIVLRLFFRILSDKKGMKQLQIYFTSNYPAEKHLRQTYVHNLASYLGVKVTVQSLSICWEEEMTCMTKKSASLLEIA